MIVSFVLGINYNSSFTVSATEAPLASMSGCEESIA